MKNLKTYVKVGALVATILFFIAADHIDAPAVAGSESDITDFYAFQGENTDNIVFVANVQGLLSPSATKKAQFDENIMIEFNIDTNGDAIEDLVIQAAPKNKRMYFLGPIAPNQTGLVSTSNSNQEVNSVKITNYNQNPRIESSSDGIKYFAGPRDDPFFFDFAQYSAILAGNADGFLEEGVDTFAGTNVLSVVVEVPKHLLGNSSSINAWVESKRKQ
ncbi:DUF4331 domain-containing protein [Sabulilitoribacter multivorans]|uniref:DUF4331 domain-containing protein n=1 Tax=Flaviramulus multivorans TaxID=1304750 RepID=A0ABS9II98_9FLAO|nr:DUF4331 family protein [Flaviramulus multivorans]MCF7560492.1 DUF4331 domain-containing protein [Flaviramulus multivorans]